MEVAVEGGRLYVEEQGAGAPILLIQGLGTSLWAWRYQLEGLSARRRAIAFDNRGVGRSSKEPGPYSIEQFADDAVSVLDALGIDRAHVVGLSMGGYISELLALRHPARVRSLLLSGTGPGAPTHTPVPQSTIDAWLANVHLGPEEFARKTMFLSFSPGWNDAEPERYAELLAARLEYPTPYECWRAQFDAATRFVETGAPVEEIRAPTLVVHGDADRIVPLENGRALADRIPGAELAILPGQGHLPPLEVPETFNRVVEQFHDRVEAL
jgi:3-oxoadipate enol-lactonase